ncbi:MAG: type I polyketide synthase [Anaerolineaceae bacterium]|nr:type I polyketide synthase [Anaerolineaceae bacterium]
MTTKPELPDRRQILKDALVRIDQLHARLDAAEQAKAEPIAIIGMGCRFPGGVTDAESYWELLRNGVDAISEVPSERASLFAHTITDSDVPEVWYGGFLDHLDQFDSQFFGISPREAFSLDPQQRLTLEVAWEALENAGQSPDQLNGSQTGIFVGVSTSDYAQLLRGGGSAQLDVYSATGSALNAIPGRVAYTLGLNGPSVAIDTACSSSLVAVHLACQSLRSGESNLALAGGVNIILMPEAYVCFTRWGMMAADGRCKVFDEAADGFVRSEGCGMLVLKRLSDAIADHDPILALVRGSAVNQDGRSSGLTVPNGPAQEAVLRRALAMAKVKPTDISYIETHGTGTLIGDPIEVEAIGTVIGEGRPQDLPLVLGAVKSNIGHAESASGIAGLIKVVLSMQHGEIPRNLHFYEANPRIPWPDFPVVVPTEHLDWTPVNGKRLAGVSGFGFSGTNAHVVLEEAPLVDPDLIERPVHLLTLSALNEPALRSLARRYQQYLAEHEDLPLVNAAYTAVSGRAQFAHRLAVIGESSAELQAELATFAAGDESVGIAAGVVEKKARPKIAFLFTGQGAQYVGMGRGLYETQPVFRAALDQCDAILRSLLKQPLLSVLYPAEGQESPLDNTTYTQPALFALEYALAQLWLSWGIQPSAVMGHSVGEYVAACIAGVFSLEDGLKLIAERGRLMGELPAGGKMAAVFADEATVSDAIVAYADQVSIAAVNGPENIVISGAGEAVERILDELRVAGVKARPLNVSHAFHSPLMEPMLDTFARTAGQIKFAAPRIRLISNVTGEVAGAEVAQATYWREHVRAAVQFSRAVETLYADGYTLFLEVGPSPTLIGMGQRIVNSEGLSWLASLRSGRDDERQLLGALGGLYTRGVPVNWAAFYGDYPHYKVPLPTYPFQRERFWPAITLSPVQHQPKPQPGLHPLLGRRLRSPAEALQFEVELGTGWLSYLNDHRIYGTAVLPGAAYVEIGLAAAQAAFGAGHFAVEELTIHDALLIPDDAPRVVQVFLTPDSADQGTFKVYSLQDDSDEWRWHAAGKVTATALSAPALPLSELQARIQQEVDVAAYYQRFDEIGLNYGPLFHGIQRVWQIPGESLGQLQMPEEILEQAGDYTLHPALLDACLQLIGAAIPDTAEQQAKVYMPLSIETAAAYQPASAQAWCHVILRRENGTPLVAGQDSYTADLYLMDEGGERIAEIIDLFMMRTSPDLLMRAVHRGYDDWLYEVNWQMQPRAEQENRTAQGHWLILSGEDETGEALANLIERQGGVCDLVEAVNAADWLGQSLTAYTIVVHLAKSVDTALSLMQVLAGRQDSPAPKVWFVTRGAQSVGQTAEPVDAEQAMLWGFGRVMALEQPELWGGLIDLEAAGVPAADMLLAEIAAADGENQIALRRGQRYVARLTHSTRTEPALTDDIARELVITERGVLDHLSLQAYTPRMPSAGEVGIRVCAAGVNFRDVLNALGMYPVEVPLGNECTGVVTRVGAGVTDVQVGDAVIALAPGTFRSYVVAPADWVFPKPANLSFAEAVTLPTTFMTAYYGLHALAQIKSGDRVLIHAGAGGVGMAAVQIALQAGAEVFATAGSDEKRAFLRSIGVHHVFNSRALDFAEEIQAVTGGAGIHIALNSLADEFIAATLSIMAEGGVFLELGALDKWNAEKVTAIYPTLRYYRYDLAEVIQSNPDAILRPFRDLLAAAEAGIFTPLPLRAFPFADVAEAFRYMAQARHIGKVVIVMDAPVAVVPDATYLVTGGLTGLGLAVAERLVERGARQVVLVGRRAPSPETQQAIGMMQQTGATITVMNVDVANDAQIADVIATIRAEMPPLRGIVHAAGVLDDALLAQQDWARFEKVFAPKVSGAWNLHTLTRGLALDFFVMFSSGSAILGAPGQSNYAAANAFMDGLAHYRRAVGLTALSINWGAWTQIGMAAERSVGERVASQGIGALSPEDGLGIFEQLMVSGAAQVVAIPIDWPKLARQLAGNEPPFLSDQIRRVRQSTSDADATQQHSLAQQLKDAPEETRPALSLAYVQAQISRVMGIPASRPVDPSQSLHLLGLDSLMAMELKNRVESDLKVTVPVAQLLEGPTVERFAEMVLDKLDSPADLTSRHESRKKGGEDATDLLTNLAQLSEEEVDALLNQMLSEKDADE